MHLNSAKVGLMLIVLVAVALIIWNIVNLADSSTRTVFNQVSVALHMVILLLALAIYYNASCTFS